MKHFKGKKTYLIYLLVGIIAIFASLNLGGTALANIYFANQVKLLPIYSVKTEERKVGISFDAAWGADKTREIMNICDEYNVKATFFLVGFWVEDYPEMSVEIADRGFEIGMHSSTHPDMTKLSSKDQKLELVQNFNIIYTVTGVKPKLFRPPFGAYNNSLIENCNKLNLKTIQWSVDSLDWKGISADEIASRVCSRVKNGSIVLFHNNSDYIINGLRMVLEFLTKNDYKVVPIGELVYESNYTIDSQGTQILRRNK